jgi:hypothetical protein
MLKQSYLALRYENIRYFDIPECQGEIWKKKEEIHKSKGKLSGRGKARPVHEDDNWNQVKVFYNGKCALDIFEMHGPDGRYFDSRFTNAENQHIVHALKKAEILTWRDYLSRHKRLGKVARPIWAVSALAGAVGAVRGVLAHDLVNVLLFSIMAVGFAFFVLRE